MQRQQQREAKKQLMKKRKPHGNKVGVIASCYSPMLQLLAAAVATALY